MHNYSVDLPVHLDMLDPLETLKIILFTHIVDNEYEFCSSSCSSVWLNSLTSEELILKEQLIRTFQAGSVVVVSCFSKGTTFVVTPIRYTDRV